MVQMKEDHFQMLTSSALLYIPHGSDERQDISEGKQVDVTTLYPTWFR